MKLRWFRKESFIQKKIAWTVSMSLIYYLIFQVSASGCSLFLKKVLGWPLRRLNQSGLPYLFAILLGFIFIIFITDQRDWKNFWEKGPKKMTSKTFGSLVCILLSGQVLTSIFASVLENGLHLFGLSALEQLKDATQQSQSISMLLYAAFFGPLIEEIVFRGLVLRRFNRINSTLAIIGSAYLFGLYHVNFIQSPFAFLIGLILGYTALTYGIGWSLVLHIFNNFILGDFLNRILNFLPSQAADEISSSIVLFGGMIGIFVLFSHRKLLNQWDEKVKLSAKIIQTFFNNKLVITMTVIVVILASLELSWV